VISSPYFNVFLAAQVKNNDKSFLSRDITVKDMIAQRGDIHHLFPKDYLKNQSFRKEEYNQIANYVYAQTEINIKIGNKSPKEYFTEIDRQCNGGELAYGGINNKNALKINLEANCIPAQIVDMVVEYYNKFLEMRRPLMRKKIFDYYYSL